MNKDLEKYKDAVWDYMLEHSDISKSGALFIKFHAESRRTFEGHVSARAQGYHRGDPAGKAILVEEIKVIHAEQAKKKKQKYKEEKAARIAMSDKIRHEVRVVGRINRMRWFINKWKKRMKRFLNEKFVRTKLE